MENETTGWWALDRDAASLISCCHPLCTEGAAGRSWEKRFFPSLAFISDSLRFDVGK